MKPKTNYEVYIKKMGILTKERSRISTKLEEQEITGKGHDKAPLLKRWEEIEREADLLAMRYGVNDQ